MKKRGWTWALALAVALGGLCVAAGTLLAQAKSPPDFAFDQGKDSPGKVTFSHEKHMVKDTKCTACHVKLFKMKKGATDTKGGAMHEEKSCGSCHNGTGAFSAKDNASCVKCHKK
jgi:c(7)-type cytochrome triheme protein